MNYKTIICLVNICPLAKLISRNEECIDVVLHVHHLALQEVYPYILEIKND